MSIILYFLVEIINDTSSRDAETNFNETSRINRTVASSQASKPERSHSELVMATHKDATRR